MPTPQPRFNMPVDSVLLNRINLSLVSVLSRLGATNCWRAICDEFWQR